MKKFFFLLSIICIGHTQGQNWQWAKSASGTNVDEGYSAATDNSGNVYITGYFNSSSLTFGSYTLTSVGSGDVFIAKYDSYGNVLWAKSFGGSSDERCYSVSVDTNGSALITGYFQSASLTIGSTTLTNNGGPDIFLAKYDSIGNVLWAKSAGGTGQDIGKSVTYDINGNIYVTGNFMSPTISFGTHTLTNTGFLDMFLTKYNSSGNVLWAKNPTGTFYDEGESVTTDAIGNVFVTGYFQSSALTFGTYTLTNVGGGDIFLAKYDTAGNSLWAKREGGANSDQGNAVSTDLSGNVYLTGFFGSTITIGNNTLTCSGISDAFIAKYDVNGTVLWADGGNGALQDVGYSISTDTSGSVFISGWFQGSSITFGSTTLFPPPNSNDPMFIVKYNANGNLLCATALASGGDDNNGICTDKFGSTYIAGDFYGNSFIIGNDTLFLGGPSAENIFIAKVDFTCPTSSISNLNSNAEAIIYPNPTNDQFFIEANSTDKLSVDLYDVNSRHVFSKVVSDRSVIDVRSLNEGVYTLTIKTADGLLNKKLVILR